MKCWNILIFILQSCTFLHAVTEEVQRYPDQDDIHIAPGMLVIVRFRLLASDLSQYDIRYRVNSSLIKVPHELNYDVSPSDLPYSATLLDCNDESSSRQCKDLAILITGRPNIHAHTFTPDFVNVANYLVRVPVVTDKLFRIHYQDGRVTPPPTTKELTESTTPSPSSSTAHPTNSPSSPPQTTATAAPSPEADPPVNKDSLEDISSVDYVMFAALFSLAITVAISLFINIILCFKLKRQNQELKYYGNNSAVV